MSIMYSSTRSNSEKVTASQAILKGLAEDGGLFVPDSIPALDVKLEDLAGFSYQETASGGFHGRRVKGLYPWCLR